MQLAMPAVSRRHMRSRKRKRCSYASKRNYREERICPQRPKVLRTLSEKNHLGKLRDVMLRGREHCLTGNLPLSASSISFPPTLYWSLLQGRNFAPLLWSSRRTWRTLERKRKIFHEANRGEVSVASAHRSPAARFQR